MDAIKCDVCGEAITEYQPSFVPSTLCSACYQAGILWAAKSARNLENSSLVNPLSICGIMGVNVLTGEDVTAAERRIDEVVKSYDIKDVFGFYEPGELCLDGHYTSAQLRLLADAIDGTLPLKKNQPEVT